MDRPSPISVMMLMANVETVVTSVISRTTTSAPTIASPPTTSGVSAATTLRKMITSRISRIGIDSSSARCTSDLVRMFASS